MITFKFSRCTFLRIKLDLHDLELRSNYNRTLSIINQEKDRFEVKLSESKIQG